jgi:hypothetical protein
VVSAEEIEALKRKLESTRERVKGNRKEAIRVLHAAGITDEAGKLTEPYRLTQDK